MRDSAPISFPGITTRSASQPSVAARPPHPQAMPGRVAARGGHVLNASQHQHTPTLLDWQAAQDQQLRSGPQSAPRSRRRIAECRRGVPRRPPGPIHRTTPGNAACSRSNVSSSIACRNSIPIPRRRGNSIAPAAAPKSNRANPSDALAMTELRTNGVDPGPGEVECLIPAQPIDFAADSLERPLAAAVAAGSRTSRRSNPPMATTSTVAAPATTRVALARSLAGAMTSDQFAATSTAMSRLATRSNACSLSTSSMPVDAQPHPDPASSWRRKEASATGWFSAVARMGRQWPAGAVLSIDQGDHGVEAERSLREEFGEFRRAVGRADQPVFG